MHTRQIAATQVDFVGHSMGGLLGRIYAGNGNPAVSYQRPENLGLGDIHKFITLDTPHFGSVLANALVDANNQESTIGLAWEGSVGSSANSGTCLPSTRLDSLSPPSCITCGAILDLREGSPALSGLPGVTVPTHVIVGRGGDAAVSDTTTFVSAMNSIGGVNATVATAINVLAASLQFIYFGTGAHDVIVSENSQLGGVYTADQITYLDPSIPFTWAVHFTVTKEAPTNDAIVNLLLAPTNSTTFGPLPPAPAQ
jgi:hypothetical protein